ncbi:MAG: MoaD/ThiS family protein [Gemmatimonadota bacterium]|nr:MoaD/ThiS family protein [Gemmatimonadota bacterium]
MAALRVRCRLFARYAEVVGREEVVLDLPADAVVADAIALLRRQVPRGDVLPERPLVAVNLAHVLHTERLRDGDELALLPPLAGG